MGMYTELYLSCYIKDNLPKNVLDVLEHLFNKQDLPDDFVHDIPDHDFFESDRWDFIGNSCSYYFVPKYINFFKFDANVKNYILITRCDIKNYNYEIDEFLNWQMPYVDCHKGKHIGHYRYEEDETPTLLYKR